jgi:hypothetical protein
MVQPIVGERQAMTLPLRPKRGGFLRPFGCGEFIHQFLLGKGPYDSPQIDPEVGACQADIFHYYKMALMRTTALDRATRLEEKRAKREKRPISPDNIDSLTERYLARMPYKAKGCRFHSFVVYFSILQKLGWVEPTGREEPSEFQVHYPPGPPRRYFRLTEAGREASDVDWANPLRALYGRKTISNR